jgi:hypothetical protein
MVMPPQEPLQEKKFIHEPDGKYPFWLWLFLSAIAACLLWGSLGWFQGVEAKVVKDSPFLQVTNRQMSLFLWQFPEYMRRNRPDKAVYMPGFDYQNKVSILPGFADETVQAPPEILFMYHTWQRLIGKTYFPRPISVKEFEEFINYAEEWKPRNWAGAPKEYADFLEKFPTVTNVENLQNLSVKQLPLEVRIAFQGWKNFFKEGDAILAMKPTFEQVAGFLEGSPKFARNYWRNIVSGNKPKYLDAFLNQDVESKGRETVPLEQMSDFMRVALYNYVQSQRGR